MAQKIFVYQRLYKAIQFNLKSLAIKFYQEIINNELYSIDNKNIILNKHPYCISVITFKIICFVSSVIKPIFLWAVYRFLKCRNGIVFPKRFLLYTPYRFEHSTINREVRKANIRQIKSLSVRIWLAIYSHIVFIYTRSPYI